MEKYSGIVASLLLVSVPVSGVLADDSNNGQQDRESINTTVNISTESDKSLQAGGAQEDMVNNEGSSTPSSWHATSTPWARGEKVGLLKHFGTTTPPGIARHTGTSTNNENLSGGQGRNEKKNNSGVFSTFWSWFFGLPATTTVADIRAQIQASTTASSTVQTPSNPGFFGRLLRFFGFGKQ